jgi:signal transduction histidine kinase
MTKPFRFPGLKAVLHSPHMALLLIVLGSVAFVATAYTGHSGLLEVGRLTAARNDAHESLMASSRTLASLVDMETSQRGYLLSGWDSFLRTFGQAEGNFQSEYPRLAEHMRRQLGDQYQARKARLDDLVWRRISSAKHNIGLRKAGAESIDLAELFRRDQNGQPAMDEIREELRRFDDLSSAAAEANEQAIASVQSRTHGLVTGMSMGGVLLVFCAVWLLARERHLRDQAESALHDFTGRLERTVDDRTNELRNAMAQIQSFTKQLDKSIEAERRRLAREVHDQFGQIVTATKMMVIDLSRNNPDVSADSINKITGLLDEAISVTRRISSELRPPLLDDLGVFAAMQVYARNLSLRSKIDTFVDVSDDDRLSVSQSNQLFRIFQEATTNILRHARAQRIWVRGSEIEGRFELEIADDGQGPQSIRENATGLRNMRERASLAGGSFQFGPGPMRGSVVRVVIPLQAAPGTSDFILQESP